MSALKQTKRDSAATEVEVFDGARSLGTVPLSGKGEWTIDVSGLADGPHSFTARVVGTNIVSSAWGVVISTPPRTEDFESNRREGHIPRGIVMTYPTMAVEMIGDECWGYYNNSNFLPYLAGFFFRFSNGSHQSYLSKVAEIRLVRPVRHFSCGLNSTVGTDLSELRCYDANGFHSTTYEYIGGLMWADVYSSGLPIARIEIYTMGYIYIDNFTLDY